MRRHGRLEETHRQEAKFWIACHIQGLMRKRPNPFIYVVYAKIHL